jgi:hypothetical protein
LFHTKGVVEERSIRIIIDGGNCNNLASMEMVEKLSLPTQPHPHPYHIQWLNQGGKLKVTHLVCVHFSLGPIMIMLIAMLFQWKHVRFCSVGLGNMIRIAYIMVAQTITL